MMIPMVPMNLGEDSSRIKDKAGNGVSSKNGYMVQHPFDFKQETTRFE